MGGGGGLLCIQGSTFSADCFERKARNKPEHEPRWPGTMPSFPSFVTKALSSYAVCGVLLIVAETVLNTLIITRKGYTEIDWKAYMEEVEPFITRWLFLHHRVNHSISLFLLFGWSQDGDELYDAERKHGSPSLPGWIRVHIHRALSSHQQRDRHQSGTGTTTTTENRTHIKQ